MKRFFTAVVLSGAIFALPGAWINNSATAAELKIPVTLTEGDPLRVGIEDAYYNTLSIEDGFITVDPEAQPITFSAKKKDGSKYVFTSFEVSEPAKAAYNIAYGEYDVSGLAEGCSITLGVAELPSQELYIPVSVQGVPSGMQLSDLVVITDCDRQTLKINAGGCIATDVTALPLKIALGRDPMTYENYSEYYNLDVQLTGPGIIEFTSPSVYASKGWYCAGLTDDSSLAITITPIEHVMLTLPFTVSGVENFPAEALSLTNSSYKAVELLDGKITVDQAKLPLQISIISAYSKEYSIQNVTVNGAEEAYAEFDQYYNAWKVYGLTEECAINVEVATVDIDWIYATPIIYGAEPEVVGFMDKDYGTVRMDEQGRLKIDPNALPIVPNVGYSFWDQYDISGVEVSNGTVRFVPFEEGSEYGTYYIDEVSDGATIKVNIKDLNAHYFELPVNISLENEADASWLVIYNCAEQPVGLINGKISVTDEQLPLTFTLDVAKLPSHNIELTVEVQEGNNASVEKGYDVEGDESSVWYRVSNIDEQTEFIVTIINDNTSRVETISSEALSGDVYNLQGIRVKRHAHDLNGLPAGIYIMNGHKYIIK